MPISGSPKEIIHTEMHKFKHGQLHSGSPRGPKVKNRAQAIAIALSEARQHRDAGGAAGRSTAVQDIINALQQGAAAYGGPSNATNPMGNAPASAPAPANAPNPNSQMPAPTGLAAGAAPMAATTAGSQAPLTNTGIGSVVGGPQMILQPGGLASNTMQRPQGFAFGGTPTPPWYVRNEARSMTHVGPIASAVPGRTDRHNLDVPSGSYVLPAETISHMGQSNSIAGLKVASRMFGPTGPYGAAIPRMGHGMGLPRPPKPMGIMDAGGSRGEGDGTPTPVVVAGGEYVIHPAVVRAIGGGDIKHGHKILDNFVMAQRKDHLKTLSKLKPPVKS